MSDPEIVLREAQPYLGIRERITDGIRAFADTAFPELFGWLGEHGVAPAGPPFLRYYEVDRAGEPVEVEAGAPVAATVLPDGDRVRADALPAGRYLTMVHNGPYRSESMPDLADTRAELMAWAEENGIVYSRETDGGHAFPCALEHYRIGPPAESDFTKWETEFAYLVL